MISIKQFVQTVWDYYRREGRKFPWREPEHTDDPYKVVVSEIMLQQTQTGRVLPKYVEFISRLPDFQSLSEVSTRELLSLWKGLGYNRRAFALREIANRVIGDFHGYLPSDIPSLESLPMVGKATARSIAAFAFNLPVLFMETNIRRVFIHFFFPRGENIDDGDLRPFLELSLQKDSPREWYYALTDYGVMLKKVKPDPNTRSRHYKKQAPFKGSRREVRGKILYHLAGGDSVSCEMLRERYSFSGEQILEAAESLVKEGLIVREGENLLLRENRREK